MDTSEQRLEKVIHAMQMLVEGQHERDHLKFLPDEGDNSQAQLERAFNRILQKTREGEAEVNIAISNLAMANVRLTKWSELVQKINITDSVLTLGQCAQDR